MHSPFVLKRTFNETPTERLQQHPLLFTTNRTDRTFFFVKAEPRTTSTSWSQHHFVAIGKARAACAQSFTLWQQATIEITRRDHSMMACSRHKNMGVVLRAHPVRGESHIQRNANGEVATIPDLVKTQLWCYKTAVLS